MKYERVLYKHRIREKLILQTSIFPEVDIVVPFIRLSTSGVLEIEHDYMWDGASGPTIDTKNTISPSAGHDALFQLMRMGLLDRGKWWLAANADMYRWMRDRNMAYIRARTWKIGLDMFSYKHTLPRESVIIEVY